MRQSIAATLLATILMFTATASWSEVKLGSLFTDNMVLQRDQPIPIWGTASPGEVVTVQFGKYSATRIASPEGTWRVLFRPLGAQAHPQTLVVSGSNTITISNVVVGDVWVCSGQSNMEFSLVGARDGVREAAHANYPSIRLFTVAKNPSPVPLDAVDGAWKVCSPASATTFSAVAYFFGRELNRQLNVPIGLIDTSWGGTPAETWTPAPALKALPQYQTQMATYDTNVQNYLAHRDFYEAKHAAEIKDYYERLETWYDKMLATDPGTVGTWADPGHSAADWKTVSIPVAMGSNPLGQYLGSIWLRKTVQIPASWVGKDLVVHVGAVDDVDETYVNGAHVGRLWYDAPSFWTSPRAYNVSASAVTSTAVTITVRAFNVAGDVGMFGPEAQMYLAPATADSLQVSLAGDWAYQYGDAIKNEDVPQQNYTPIPGSQAGDPAALYNGMIGPLTPFAIKGAIWYQGESNAADPVGYRTLFPSMITAWRTAWGEGNFPFAFVQLANFMPVQTEPIEASSWADIRESQAAALGLPNTSMATIIDIGDANNIHPTDKQDVGLRLALPILAKAYGKRLIYSGPVYKAMSVSGGKITVSFDCADGLTAKGNKLTGFAIAGCDKIFHFAQARVNGSQVTVWSDKVPNPTAVRYAWANNPICNLYNGADLPAPPFRTDSWKPAEIGVAKD